LGGNEPPSDLDELLPHSLARLRGALPCRGAHLIHPGNLAVIDRYRRFQFPDGKLVDGSNPRSGIAYSVERRRPTARHAAAHSALS
jgi:hypothetical protein